MNRLLPLLAVLVASTFSASAAQATTLVQMSADQMVDASDVIVEGTVLSVATVIDEHGHPLTQATVRVDVALKGTSRVGEQLLVESAGGVLDDGVAVNVEAAARYDEGERVMLYLAPQRFGAAYGTVAMMMGKFTIKQNPADGSDMVVRFAVPYSEAYDARFIPNPPKAERVSLAEQEAAIARRVELGWDGRPVAGVPVAHLRQINKLQPGVK